MVEKKTTSPGCLGCAWICASPSNIEEPHLVAMTMMMRPKNGSQQKVGC
jgi:hypothetical protein